MIIRCHLSLKVGKDCIRQPFKEGLRMSKPIVRRALFSLGAAALIAGAVRWRPREPTLPGLPALTARQKTALFPLSLPTTFTALSTSRLIRTAT